MFVPLQLIAKGACQAPHFGFEIKRLKKMMCVCESTTATRESQRLHRVTSEKSKVQHLPVLSFGALMPTK
jgi:hypothetical protein